MTTHMMPPGTLVHFLDTPAVSHELRGKLGVVLAIKDLGWVATGCFLSGGRVRIGLDPQLCRRVPLSSVSDDA